MRNRPDTIITRNTFGCDFTVQIPESWDQPVRVLQLTDPQLIDSSQRRKDSKMSVDAIKAWAPENFDAQCANHIRSLITQTKPALMLVTGDIVYGRYDDEGTALSWFAEFMDSFGIPWAPVFGNHDNESAIGVDRQCEMFENKKYCLFKRGEVTGNGNYSVGVAVGERLIRVFHMLDTNGCSETDDPKVMKEVGLFPDQLELVEKNTERIREAVGDYVDAFLAFHIPHSLFPEAERTKGYVTEERQYYRLGVDVEAQDGDYGFKLDGVNAFETETDLAEFAKKNHIEGIFIGHHHNTSTTIHYKGLTLVYGLKTGQYDSYIPGNIGGTLITLYNGTYSVLGISSMCSYGPVPSGAQRYKGFFVQ